MRFNSKELTHIVEQGVVDKEGILSMKYKPEGRIFKKEETYITRHCKLKGNLLFYYKNKESKNNRKSSSAPYLRTEPLGVLVLERCTIELDDEIDNAFIIVFEGDEPTYHFATRTEAERDEWIQALHLSSYECLKMQLQSLREQIQAKTGRDPVSQPPPTETGMAFETQSGNANTNDEPAMEICLACEDLPNDSSANPPNPFIVIYTINPPQQQTWVQHSHTEVVEKTNSPQFLKTIGFGDSTGIDTNTRIKLTVYHVKERMTGTMSQMGQVIFTVQDVLTSHQMELSLPLQGPDPVDCGTVKVMAWVNDTNISVPNGPADDCKNDKLKKSPCRRRSKRVDTLRPLYRGIITRTFRFDTSDGRVKLLVHEYMAEAKLAFDIPLQLIKLWIDEEKSMIDQIKNLGQLWSWYEKEQVTAIDLCATIVTEYTKAYNYLTNYLDTGHDIGPSFKPSIKKGDKDLEFAPLNLHLQRMTVINELNDTTSWYDIVTVGAFTAYAQKYKHGGLMKLLQHQKEFYSADGTLSKNTKLDKACQLINSIYKLNVKVNNDCQRLCDIASNGLFSEMKSIAEHITEHVKELVNVCDNKLLQGSEELYNAVREEVLYQKTLEMSKNELTESFTDLDMESSTENLSGTNFKKNPSMEPWELSRVNTEAACVCLTSLVESLESVDRTKWLNSISQDVAKLKNFVAVLHNKAVSFMTFLNIMENKGHSKLNYTIKYRRDVCFSHAVTALVTGFMTKLTTHTTDTHFLNQLCQVGMLVQFEGLLSCHSDENGMIEDMIVAVDDLSQVVFKVKVEEHIDEGPVLSLHGKLKYGSNPDFQRHGLIVTVPVKAELFERLPDPLQKGKHINITPVFFNIGINEQATVAERFGDTSLQEKLNFDNYGILYRYIEKYQSKIGDPDDGKTGLGTVGDLMKRLQYQVMAKKSKNTEVLKLASELTRKLQGIRFTSCKSAKDRTAMSITLEQVYILQQEHDLASHVFTQALDCFRSEGVRRENTLKNIGCRKYAFNSFQLLYVPKLYRPPNGTYGNVQG
ncbi:inositol polyphosphate-4-phosphatase type I A-like isoform X3 [Mytilus californianus]|uniref:inositol polyphosphate-4-phosphatase type I A-like isoform X3 n=1 Tax=Mytilus californianus TaxID=6549 RepID=UPI0022455C64|nr:inositol polyphosphate-4-phosphatase type I A-like isoform X3 [Mytilus californianus]